jgi:hypothetical protein
VIQWPLSGNANKLVPTRNAGQFEIGPRIQQTRNREVATDCHNGKVGTHCGQGPWSGSVTAHQVLVGGTYCHAGVSPTDEAGTRSCPNILTFVPLCVPPVKDAVQSAFHHRPKSRRFLYRPTAALPSEEFGVGPVSAGLPGISFFVPGGMLGMHGPSALDVRISCWVHAFILDRG